MAATARRVLAADRAGGGDLPGWPGEAGELARYVLALLADRARLIADRDTLARSIDPHSRLGRLVRLPTEDAR